MSDAIDFKVQLEKRHRVAKIWLALFQLATIFGMVILSALLLNIINSAFGFVAVEYEIEPESLAIQDIPIENLPKEYLVEIVRENISPGLFRGLESKKPFEQRSREDVFWVVVERVLEPKVVSQWSLYESLFLKEQIIIEKEQDFPQADLQFESWIDSRFIINPQSGEPMRAGIRTAILGSLWVVGVAFLFSFPIGVGAAIYLEEYASDNFINRIIQVNINNLAGVPSIIYGILGLAIFVRILGNWTSGIAFGAADPLSANGRTVLSAGLTLGILILPIIIINAQEALRAVPDTLRRASLGLGATLWETIWHHVLPGAMPGILTGTILAVSRAIGETAPLIVVGASTFITVDPTSPFSKFTTLPIQIYQWTARPQDVFRNIAAAAILVLLVMLLSLNTGAVIMRNRYSRRNK